jgi:hypothetical protein
MLGGAGLRPPAAFEPAATAGRRRPRVTPGRVALLVAAAAASALWSADAAGAAVACGQVDEATNRPARAILTLDEKTAVTTRALKRSTKPKTLSLVFTVTGCELVEVSPPPTLLVLPTPGGGELPDDALTLRRAEVDGSTFFLSIQVDPAKMDPGTYNSIVIARAPYLASNRTPVTVSRSEDAEWKVLGLGVLASVAGLIWLLFLKVPAIDSSGFTRSRLIALCVLAVAAGTYAAASSYFSQDVWTFDDNFFSLASAAFLAATTGSVAALLIGASKA